MMPSGQNSLCCYVVGTFDTKGDELRYLVSVLQSLGISIVTVDLTTFGVTTKADISASQVAAHHVSGVEAVTKASNRSAAVVAMADAFAKFIISRDDIGGIIGLGGSSGTWLVTKGMREIPIGIPKIMVTTVASGDISGYIGASDICMVPSITDIFGLNDILKGTLATAAGMLAGAMNQKPTIVPDKRPLIGLTMFGVTTPCVTAVVEALKPRFQCLVFHATGIGGQVMEKLVDEGKIVGVIDITTTDIADLIGGGVFPAHSDRLGAIIRKEIPYVGSVGALTSVNFGAPATVPERYKLRDLIYVTPQVTVMRTTAEENEKIANWFGSKLSQCKGPVCILLPMMGLSTEHTLESDSALDGLYTSLEGAISPSANRRVTRLPYNINDKEFAAAIVNSFESMFPK
jgi:uncharacterized protein (UPF0261 family)